MYLSVIELPDAVVNCNDVLCTNDEHKEQIEVYCDMCLKAGSKCFPHIQTKQHKSIPSWKGNITAPPGDCSSKELEIQNE